MVNRKELQKLIKAKDARLAPIAPTTAKGHADGTREPSTAFALALYARLGLPLEGWLSCKELVALDKAAPRPLPDSVYDGFDPSEAAEPASPLPADGSGLRTPLTGPQKPTKPGTE